MAWCLRSVSIDSGIIQWVVSCIIITRFTQLITNPWQAIYCNHYSVVRFDLKWFALLWMDLSGVYIHYRLFLLLLNASLLFYSGSGRSSHLANQVYPHFGLSSRRRIIANHIHSFYLLIPLVITSLTMLKIVLQSSSLSCLYYRNSPLHPYLFWYSIFCVVYLFIFNC